MEKKFKIGDRVRIIKSYEDEQYNVGYIGTICNGMSDDSSIDYEIVFGTIRGKKSDPLDYQSQWWARQELLEIREPSSMLKKMHTYVKLNLID